MRRRSLEGIDALAGVETEERMKKGALTSGTHQSV
jgi:hypothetical protein